MSLISAAATSTPSSGSTGSIDGNSGGGGWSLPDWSIILGPLPKILADAGEKMDRVTTTVSDVMSGKFLKDSIDNLVILWSDEAAEPLMSVFQKVYLFTPRIAELNFVQTLWSIITLLCVIALFVGSGILANQVLRGKKEMGALLKGFIVSLVTSILSLTILNMINVIANWITQVAVEGIIGTEGIDYTSLTGFEILKASGDLGCIGRYFCVNAAHVDGHTYPIHDCRHKNTHLNGHGHRCRVLDRIRSLYG
jgi:hypothetical protein